MIDIPDIFLDRDEHGVLLCPKCHKTIETCTCPSYDPQKPKTDLFMPLVRLEKKGRAGKTVTCVYQLPANELYLKEITKIFKARIGAGGTFYIDQDMGIIELQGDHRCLTEKLLLEQGFQRHLKGKKK